MSDTVCSSSPSTEAERHRQVDEAVHSIRMEGLDLSPEGSADAAEYVAGRISLDEYGQRTRARYGVPEVGQRGSGTRAHSTRAVAAGRAASRPVGGPVAPGR